MNPFRYGKIVSGEHYCSRVEDERLSKAIRGGRNVALIGRRRVGKSSSIYHVAGNLLPKHTLVYADFYQVGSVEDIVQRILTGLPRQGLDWLREFAKGLTRLRPKIELDPATGIPSLALGSDAVMDEHSLEQILTELGKLKRTIVAFDEFQDVATLETGPAVLARMRSIIQRQETVYVFSGSIRKSMSVIFDLRC